MTTAFADAGLEEPAYLVATPGDAARVEQRPVLRRLTQRPCQNPIVPLPDPALVVLVGASGSGKSTWAAARYRRAEVVSSDDLRGVVGSGPHDLDASDDAFALLDRIVAARLARGLTTVVDTLGLDADRRRAGATRPGRPGCPPSPSLLDTPDDECRRRNAAPRPAGAGAGPRRAARRRRRRPRRRSATRAGTVVDVVVSGPARPRGRPQRGTTPTTAVADRSATAARRPGAAGGAAGLAVPLGRGPGALAARRWRWPPTRPASPGSR